MIQFALLIQDKQNESFFSVSLKILVRALGISSEIEFEKLIELWWGHPGIDKVKRMTVLFCDYLRAFNVVPVLRFFPFHFSLFFLSTTNLSNSKFSSFLIDMLFLFKKRNQLPLSKDNAERSVSFKKIPVWWMPLNHKGIFHKHPFLGCYVLFC